MANEIDSLVKAGKLVPTNTFYINPVIKEQIKSLLKLNIQ